MSMSRREFIATSSAAVVAAGTLGRASVFGANDRVRMCVVGLNGRGGSHIEGFEEYSGSEVVALCDVDARVLKRRAANFKEKYGKTPKTYRDIRDALADDGIDAISIATPNHWHSLGAIWACQAGKDVYVEKPLSHSMWEGRQLVNAVRESSRVVQHGTQSRSDPTWMRDIRLMHEGIIGTIHLAKGFTYKTGNRHSIGFKPFEDAPSHLDWTLWQGPAEEQRYCKNYVHYNWHWFWNYGNGEIGNQGVHQMDLAVWGMNRGLPVKVYSTGGRYAWDDQGETPNTQITTFTYADGTIMEFEVRNIGSYQEAGKTTGNHFLGSKGYYVEGKGFFDYDHEAIPVDEPRPKSAGPWGNFIEAVKSRNEEDIRGTALEGHLSAAHCHLGNIAYRRGIALAFDPKTERFVDDDEANALLKRDYRKGFEVPDLSRRA